MFCAECGAQVGEGQKFCGRCGAPLVDRQTPMRVIPDAAAPPPISNEAPISHSDPSATAQSTAGQDGAAVPPRSRGLLAIAIVGIIIVWCVGAFLYFLRTTSQNPTTSTVESGARSAAEPLPGAQARGRTSSGQAIPAPNAPPYAFNGGYASYQLHYGSVTDTAKMTLTGVDLTKHTYTVQLTGILFFLSAIGNNVGFKQGTPYLLSPLDLEQIRRHEMPPDLRGTQLEFDVPVLVPAEKFTTVEVFMPVSQYRPNEDTRWYDTGSGVVMPEKGGDVLAALASRRVGQNVPEAVMELVQTNIPKYEFNHQSARWHRM